MYDTISLPDIVYKAPVRNSRGGLNLYMDTSATNKRNPKFQLPKMRAPFGVSDKVHSDNEFARKNLELSLEDEECLAWVKKLDAQNIEKAAENSEEWFRKKLSAEALSETLYRHSAQEHKEGKFAPLFRVKISDPSARRPTNIYIVEKDAITGAEKAREGTYDEITPNSHVTAIVEIGGLW